MKRSTDDDSDEKPRRLRTMLLVLGVLVGCIVVRHYLNRPEVPPLGIVSGVVTVNGLPLADAEVKFLPDPEQGTLGFTATAWTDSDGRYRARIGQYRQDGAVVGKHRVVVNTHDVNGDAPPTPPGGRQPSTQPKAAPHKGKVTVPREYWDATTTPLRPVEVMPGEQVYDIAITIPPNQPPVPVR